MFQAFRIKVEPDVQEQPMAMDISSVVSKPITVLSKRINKPGKGKRTNIVGGIGVKRSAGERSVGWLADWLNRLVAELLIGWLWLG